MRIITITIALKVVEMIKLALALQTFKIANIEYLISVGTCLMYNF